MTAGFVKEQGGRALVIQRVHEEARDIRAFDVLPEGARDCHDISFTPGQVALLEVGGAGGGGGGGGGGPLLLRNRERARRRRVGVLSQALERRRRPRHLRDEAG